ncbi:DNA segregation ATPase FtsK/SpoIIIE, S-DNA-T family [Pedobacter hartonius]|uniref:DNA segregation ATPase FtsK/SpoIIIE, S-DNA-T family n=1 Tax=Pedobacter hartonius TaxID=425514 RepID=A0A1H4HFN5_9SPHI|nr:DNA segregation ATPase FtsK/SpoIIIE, S-DNA-T family [Pedobacter hartonius]
MDNINSGSLQRREEQFDNYDPRLDLASYNYPNIDLLETYIDSIAIDAETLEINKNKIVETFSYSQIEIDKIRAIVGPSLTLYEFIPAPGVRVSKIKSLKDDLALILAAEINIVGPIPGRGCMGVEVPHLNRALVSMRSLLATEKFQKCDFDLPIALGKNMVNDVFVADLSKLPHLLIAGATGQGKSVCLNAILLSLLYKKHPSQLKFVLIDTNSLELGLFRKIEHHFLAKLPGNTEAIVSDKLEAINTLNGLVIETDHRYDLFNHAGVRQIAEYNQKFIDRKLNPNDHHRFLPFIVVVIDEFAELLMDNNDIELVISRLAQLGRAAGIHLIISTQRPSVNIITGTIKANFTARLAFRVTSAIDSRTILDSIGAESLNGYGDMLMSNGTEIVHLQGAFVDTTEVERVNEFIGNQRGYPEAFLLPQNRVESVPQADFDPDDRDSMFEDAARLIVMHQQGSTSLIQRKLKLGYNRAGRIIEQLEAAGVVGPFDGSRAREVNLSDNYALEVFLDNLKSGKPLANINKEAQIDSLQAEESTVKDIPTEFVPPPFSNNEVVSELKKKSFWSRFFE